MTLEEVNQLDENGNSALHFSVQHEHTEIVQLLLERGASRQQLNKFGKTPLQSCRSENRENMQKLFRRPITNDDSRYRYITQNSDVEWNFRNNLYTWPNRLYLLNQMVRRDSNDSDEFSPLSHGLNKALEYLTNANELKECPRMEEIEYFIREAVRTDNSEYLLRAYTAETGFYKRLNLQLTKHDEIYGYHEYRDWSNYFAAYLYGLNCKSQMQRPLAYLGVTYRGMKVKASEISRYKVGEVICNKSFLSTSTDRQIAEIFSGWNDPKQEGEVAVVCHLYLNNVGTGLQASVVSEFPDEEEILIVPMSYFIVERVGIPDLNGNLEIELHEYIDNQERDPDVPFSTMYYEDISRKKIEMAEAEHDDGDSKSEVD